MPALVGIRTTFFYYASFLIICSFCHLWCIWLTEGATFFHICLVEKMDGGGGTIQGLDIKTTPICVMLHIYPSWTYIHVCQRIVATLLRTIWFSSIFFLCQQQHDPFFSFFCIMWTLIVIVIFFFNLINSNGLTFWIWVYILVYFQSQRSCRSLVLSG